MKPNTSNMLSEGMQLGEGGLSALQFGQVAEIPAAACGQGLLEVAGLTTFEETMRAFVSDPGTAVPVTSSAEPYGFVVDGVSKGWLVVDRSGGDLRGTVHQSFAGAAAQVWAIVSTHDAVRATMTPPSATTADSTPGFAFDCVGPLGTTTLVMSNLAAG
jgi:hypothetical protein